MTERSKKSPRNRKPFSRTALLCGALVLLVCFAYLPSLSGGFIWDDDTNVTDNLQLRTLAGLRRIWLEPGATQQFYPITYTSFWLDHHLLGSNPFGYHLENVLLHALAALLLWRLLAKLRVPGAWLGAALFALHPVCVESIAWVTERKNTLSGVFFLGSLLAATKFWLPNLNPAMPISKAVNRAKTSPAAMDFGPWKFYWLALILYTGALMSKTSAVGLPVVILLLLWWQHRKPDWHGLGLTAPFFAVGLAMGLITMKVEKSMGASGEGWAYSPLERCLIAGRDLWFYLGKLIWPHPLTFFYPRWAVHVLQPWGYLLLAAIVVGSALLWRKREGWGRPALFVVGYFVAMLFPVLGFFNVSFFQFSFVADHLQYLACIGPLALSGALIAKALDAQSNHKLLVKQAIVGALLLGLAALTWRQAGEYRSAETLWRNTLADNPGSWTAHYILGNTLAGKGEFDDALREYNIAAQMDPNYAYAHFGLGNIQAERGNLNGAIQEYNTVLSLKPNFTKARINLGNILFRHGDHASAEQQFRMVLKTETDNPDAHFNLGNTLAAEGKVEEAIREYSQTLQLDSGYAYAHYSLANLLAGKGDLNGAIQEYNRTLQIDSENVEAHYNLGNVFSSQDKVDAAIQEYTLALKIKPDYVEALYNLGNVQAGKGNLDEAIKEYFKVLQIRPDFVQAHFNLGNFLAARGRFAEAREQFNIALRLKPDYPEAQQQLQAVNQAEAVTAAGK